MVILTLVSLLVVYSSTGSSHTKYSRVRERLSLQAVLASSCAGGAGDLFAHRVNYTIYSWVALIFCGFHLLLIYSDIFGVKLNEGTRWIKLPVINMTFRHPTCQARPVYVPEPAVEPQRYERDHHFHRDFVQPRPRSSRWHHLPVHRPVRIFPIRYSSPVPASCSCSLAAYVPKHLAGNDRTGG